MFVVGCRVSSGFVGQQVSTSSSPCLSPGRLTANPKPYPSPRLPRIRGRFPSSDQFLEAVSGFGARFRKFRPTL